MDQQEGNVLRNRGFGCRNGVKPRSHLPILVILFAAAFQCFALRSVGIVSKTEAKEMGIEVRATAAGPEALWLELEFKPEGKLKSYQHVELEIEEGDKSLIGYAELAGKRSSSGSVVVRLMASRAFVAKITLSIITGFPSNFSAHQLRMKDFIELDKIQ